ncbi:MAG: arylesterase [Gemmatimonadota bacterium]
MKRKIAVFLLVALTLLTGCSDPDRAGSAAAGGSAAEAASGRDADRAGDAISAPAPEGVADLSAAPAAPAAPAPPDRGGAYGAPAAARDRGVVLFLGTSLSAGYGLDEQAAYPALIQARIDSAGLPFRVVNAGLSGETAAGGLRRLEWSLQEPLDVLVLELGANDGLRGHDVAATRRTLAEILERTRARYPEAELVVLGMETPPNMGAAYTERFRAMYPALAREYDAVLVPFLLEGVAGDPALNQADGIHPTAAGQRILAATVWRALGPLLEARAARR